MKISEIFYSLQGEGARSGSANVFIRVQGCKTQNACYSMGIRCDTEFESGKDYSIDELLERIKEFNCKNIIWTGGEPADQLTTDIVERFKKEGYYQAVETSGLFAIPENIDYITISPKVAEHVVKKNFKRAHELRYVRHEGQEIPQPQIEADNYYISPHSDGFDINEKNLKYCINLCLKNPKWKLSVQQHKLWSVL